MVFNTPWGVHFASAHPDAQHGQHGVPPFTGAAILASVPCHVNRRILEEVFIRDRQPAVNRDCGWVLIWSYSFLPWAIIKLFAEIDSSVIFLVIGASVTFNVNWLICKLVAWIDAFVMCTLLFCRYRDLLLNVSYHLYAGFAQGSWSLEKVLNSQRVNSRPWKGIEFRPRQLKVLKRFWKR